MDLPTPSFVGADRGGATAGSRCATWHGRQLRQRLQEECDILRKVACPLALYLLMMLYGAAILFRNIAFYRYRGLDWYADEVMPRSVSAGANDSAVLLIEAATGRAVPLLSALRPEWNLNGSAWNVTVPVRGPALNFTALHGQPFNLRDVSQELLWDLSGSPWAKELNEVVAQTLVYAAYLFCVLPLFVSFPGKARPHSVAMFYRLQRALCCAHILRVPTYLATAIPGAAAHCQSTLWTDSTGAHGAWQENQEHVQTVEEWFFSTWNLEHNSNCGDLVFSGHVVTAMTNVLIVQYYARRMMPRPALVLTCCLGWSLFLLQLFLVLTAHNHYTVDVVVACYVAPLNFVFQAYLFPEDPRPRDAASCGGSGGGPRGEARLLQLA